MCLTKTQSRLLNLTAPEAENSDLKYKHACMISKGNKKIVVTIITAQLVADNSVAPFTPNRMP